MSTNDPSGFAPAGDSPGEPSEEELRAAYERELSRITTADLALQAAVSLLNLGGRRLGLTPGGEQPAQSERDLEQVRDAIDGVRALLEILERRRPQELGPLRDALSQLQMAYARETSAQAQGAQPAADAEKEEAKGDRDRADAAKAPGADGEDGQDEGEHPSAPGPAESSGRLWVPGR